MVLPAVGSRCSWVRPVVAYMPELLAFRCGARSWRLNALAQVPHYTNIIEEHGAVHPVHLVAVTAGSCVGAVVVVVCVVVAVVVRLPLLFVLLLLDQQTCFLTVEVSPRTT